jgi:hypothetical protein
VTTLRNLVIMLARTCRDHAATTLAATPQLQARARRTALRANGSRPRSPRLATEWATPPTPLVDIAVDAHRR